MEAVHGYSFFTAERSFPAGTVTRNAYPCTKRARSTCMRCIRLKQTRRNGSCLIVSTVSVSNGDSALNAHEAIRATEINGS